MLVPDPLRQLHRYGDGTIRLTVEQDILWPNVPEKNLEAMQKEPLFQKFKIFPGNLEGSLVSCTGAQVQHPTPVSTALGRNPLQKSTMDLGTPLLHLLMFLQATSMVRSHVLARGGSPLAWRSFCISSGCYTRQTGLLLLAERRAGCQCQAHALVVWGLMLLVHESSASL